jgi:hypothetical protein
MKEYFEILSVSLMVSTSLPPALELAPYQGIRLGLTGALSLGGTRRTVSDCVTGEHYQLYANDDVVDKDVYHELRVCQFVLYRSLAQCNRLDWLDPLIERYPISCALATVISRIDAYHQVQVRTPCGKKYAIREGHVDQHIYAQLKACDAVMFWFDRIGRVLCVASI